jgi:hypothetical protein
MVVAFPCVRTVVRVARTTGVPRRVPLGEKGTNGP